MPTYTRGFVSAQQRRLHFMRHGGDFPFASEQEYEDAADIFLGAPLDGGVLECVVPGGNGHRTGRIVRFNPATDEFGMLSPDGLYILTFYKVWVMSGTTLAYYQRQC